MADLYWAFENGKVRDAGALPPEPLDLAYGRPDGPAPRQIARAAALGRPVTPADCGPIRLISQYGFTVRCPGRAVLQRTMVPSDDHATASLARSGLIEVGGDRWPVGDSGFIASWITGSEYVKIQTGIMIFFPATHYLYQGPLPNAQLNPDACADVMAGLEYPSAQRRWKHEGELLAWSSINVIVRLPPPGQRVELAAGEPLVWVFPAPSRAAVRMQRMPPESLAQGRP